MKAAKQLLKELNDSLPKGISAYPAWYGPRLIITYQVRFMLDGERINLGTFNTLNGAIEAMVNYKIRKLSIINKEELNARAQAFVDQTMLEASQGVQEQHISLSDIRIAMIRAATMILPAHKLTGENDVDFLWDASFGGDDKLYTITPKMLRAYYAAIEHDAKIERLRNEQSSQPAAAQQPANTESDNSELSDEEYNKLMGLSD